VSHPTLDADLRNPAGRAVPASAEVWSTLSPRLQRVALGGLSFLAFFAMTDFNLYMRPEFGAALALLAMCFAGATPWRELGRLPLVRVFGVFTVFLIAQAAYATWVMPSIPWDDHLTVVAKFVRLGVFCCVVGWWLSVRPAAIAPLLGLMVLGLLLAVLYHMPWTALPAIWQGQVRPRFGIPENLSGQLAAVGGWLALCLLIGIWRDHPHGRRRNVLLAVGLLAYVGCFCVLVFSQSRGAWFAFLSAPPLAILGYWLSRRPRSLRTLPWQPILVMLAVSVVLLLGARDIFALRFAGADRMLPQVAEQADPAGPEPGAAPTGHTPGVGTQAQRTSAADDDHAGGALALSAPSPALAPAPAPVPSSTADQPPSTSIDTSIPANKAVSVRLRLYELGMEKFRERPLLGWGLDSIPVLIGAAHLDLAGEHHVHLHSAYLDALVGIGLIGSLLLLALFALLMRELFLAWRADIISRASFWALAGCVGIVLVTNAFDSLLWRFEYARAPLELLFGCCIAYALMRRRGVAEAGGDVPSAAARN
jgi:hypothetical protein